MATLEPTDPSGNDPTLDLYIGSVYAFEATGGFVMERGFDTIKLAEQTAPVHVDVTNAIQIALDVSLFNNLLDLPTFDAVSDSFATDEITLDISGLMNGLTNPSQVLSVGKYETLYQDFQTYVANYFGFSGGFSSLFVAASEFAIDEDNVFDGESFIALLNGVTEDASGHYISNLEGSITISNIAKLLKYTVDGNVFGNRNPEDTNWGVKDGFVAGDLIWVPTGTQITLKLAIDAEAFAPLNNAGPGDSFGGTIGQTQNTTFTEGDYFSLTTQASTELITRVAKAPLLIKLITV